MFTASFGSNDNLDHWSKSFASPQRIIVAHHLGEVLPLLEAVEIASNSGVYAVVMLSYEAAPAFDYALVTHPASDLPLAWAALFDSPTKVSPTHQQYRCGDWQPQISHDAYTAAIDRIREQIEIGNTYQVNYTFPMTTSFNGDAFAFFKDLQLAQGAKYSAYLDLGRYQILSLSPELFFEQHGRRVVTKPMKGTIKRGRYVAEDAQFATQLRNSTKDQAENVMIVDLLRNDLGKVSVTGSVTVHDLYAIERFRTVWQMTSTIQSNLTGSARLTDVLTALFPCGSITGAPKIRTMSIIKELESRPRGIYTGTIGLIQPGGDCVFNVAIRTVVIDSLNGSADFGVGGGITYDSTAEREYEECMVKSRFLSSRTPRFELFESLLLDRGKFHLLDRHVQRLRDSASYFDFLFREDEIERELATAAATYADGKWKVRLLLSPGGEVSITAEELRPVEHIRRVVISPRPVDSCDRFLFHKTTRRQFYDDELRTHPHCDDVIFFNERGEVTESTIANVVVRLDGRLVTPPVEAGLLPGTLRAQLLDEKEIDELTITVADLKRASELFLINSVRGWMKAELLEQAFARVGRE